MESQTSSLSNQQSKQPQTDKNQFPSVFSLYKESWAALKLAFIPLLKLGLLSVAPLILFLVPLVLQIAVQNNGDSNTIINAISILFGLVGIVVLILVAIRVLAASTYIQLQAVRQTKVGPREALEHTKVISANFFLLNLLVGLIVIVGLILLIIPGLFMLKRYIMAGYHMIDENLSVSDAMERSVEFSKKYGGAHWGLVGLQFVLSAIGYIPVIGGIISLILSIIYYMAPAVRYQQVKTAG